MARNTLSSDSMTEATRWRARLSGHGKAMGSAGYRPDESEHAEQRLSGFGESVIVDHGASGYGDIVIGAAWDNIQTKKQDSGKGGFFKRLAKKIAGRGVDVDLGCLYELQDGTRGAIQAFGNLFGNFDKPPFISLSGDERTGNKEGDDEVLHINGDKWAEIKRLLVYVYIYEGAPDWAALKPRIGIHIPGEPFLSIIPAVRNTELAVCAVAGIENVRNAIKFTNYGEYFPGHAEMDRAYGFGLKWDDGRK